MSSLTSEERTILAERDNLLTEQEKQLIRCVFNELYDVADKLDVRVANDDRATKLEVALIKFILTSERNNS